MSSENNLSKNILGNCDPDEIVDQNDDENASTSSSISSIFNKDYIYSDDSDLEILYYKKTDYLKSPWLEEQFHKIKKLIKENDRITLDEIYENIDTANDKNALQKFLTTTMNYDFRDGRWESMNDDESSEEEATGVRRTVLEKEVETEDNQILLPTQCNVAYIRATMGISSAEDIALRLDMSVEEVATIMDSLVMEQTYMS